MPAVLLCLKTMQQPKHLRAHFPVTSKSIVKTAMMSSTVALSAMIWLNPVITPPFCGCVVDLISKDIPATEAADTLYSLLLLRALAMAETQDIHPLELKEVKYIWGDYHGLPLEKVWHAGRDGQIPDAFASVPQTLPFSFNANILTPFATCWRRWT